MINAIFGIKFFDIFIDIFSTAIVPEAFNFPSSLPFPSSLLEFIFLTKSSNFAQVLPRDEYFRLIKNCISQHPLCDVESKSRHDG
jgi:hypothetical protein